MKVGRKQGAWILRNNTKLNGVRWRQLLYIFFEKFSGKRKKQMALESIHLAHGITLCPAESVIYGGFKIKTTQLRDKGHFQEPKIFEQ